MTRVLSGEGADLTTVALDMSDIPPQRRDIYAVARNIPVGATLSYGEIAARLGDGGDARDVGEAMARNPFPIIVPCHRVLAAGGKIGGFSAAGGVVTKSRLLEIEAAGRRGANTVRRSPARDAAAPGFIVPLQVPGTALLRPAQAPRSSPSLRAGRPGRKRRRRLPRRCCRPESSRH